MAKFYTEGTFKVLPGIEPGKTFARKRKPVGSVLPEG